MNTDCHFDPEMLRRYSESGPRYTSYPTAPQFREEFNAADFQRHASNSNAEPIPRQLSLYAHVPYCFSPCFYCGCNRVITRDERRGEHYIERLLLELAMVAPLFARDRDVCQVHFGGGTPNFLKPGQLGRVLASMGRHFHFSDAPDRDFSIELDPRYVSVGDIAELAQLGFNRASLGVQDFDPAVQAAVNRVQSIQETLAIIEACHQYGMRSVNVDLIYGLPRQTYAGFSATLDTIISAAPGRVAIYGYAHMPGLFKAQKQIQPEELPDREGRLGLLTVAINKLTSAGYEYIGMDHFALATDDLSRARQARDLHRNFMGYTTHADCDLIGLGVSAISHVGDSYSQNPRDLTSWEAALDNDRLPVWRGVSLSADDIVRAEVIQQLMCGAEVRVREIERRFGISFSDYFANEQEQLESLQGDGLITIDSECITVTSRGRYLLRIIAMCFDHYQQPVNTATANYSQVV
ncbi:oxygen-independent coproporphyrinogen III oxidase [Woeseia oceani]|uniref:Coproporphyrinogen-III oxidase n=1 Tax=Woeseia oceani TaxID=1548547 RepID=A0A193LJI0_9GAMM|nr:oxygen-independent coproporphyrinogen III oxidase [Woeseia oceani]ANO52554.1 oxygen-independent coproporphyrinogen III oxidase [Woeseia oceani]